MQTFLISDLDPGLDDASIPGASVTIYSSFAEAERVWRQALDDCARYVFQTFEWNTVWQDTIGSTERVREHIVRVAARTDVDAAPLGIYDHHHFASLQFLGGGLTDYNAPVIDRAFARNISPTGFARLCRAIVGVMPRVDLVCLVRMPKTIEETPNPMLNLPEVRRAGMGYAAALTASLPILPPCAARNSFARTAKNGVGWEARRRGGPYPTMRANATRSSALPQSENRNGSRNMACLINSINRKPASFMSV